MIWLQHLHQKPTVIMFNSRQHTFQKATKFFFAALFWIPVAFFSLLLVRNTLPYFNWLSLIFWGLSLNLPQIE
jgi:hypothetical protein